MSEILLPPGLMLPPTIQPKEEPDADASDLQKNQAVPRPTGYKLLCAVPTVSETFDGTAIVKADAVMKSEEVTTAVLFVVAIGPDAYTDKEKFPSGPWCAEGDFVLVRNYTGTRFKVFGREFRVINDDQVEGVVSDPRGISRA